MESAKINYPAGRKPSPRISIPIQEVIERYTAGESLKKIAESFRCDRSVIQNRLVRAGVEIRGRSAAEREKWKAIKTDRAAIERQCGKAWTAVRGKDREFTDLCLRARSRFTNQTQIHAGEQEIADCLKERGLTVFQQFPLGPYNIDIAIPALGIAVEVVSSNWKPDQAVGLFDRTKYLLDNAWAVIFVFRYRRPFKTRFSPQRVAKNIVALSERASGGLSIWGKHGVIDSQGEPIPTLSNYLDCFPIIEGFKPGVDSSLHSIAG